MGIFLLSLLLLGSASATTGPGRGSALTMDVLAPDASLPYRMDAMPESGEVIYASDGEPFAGFGESVSGDVDVDGDGFDDVLVGAYPISWIDAKGTAYLFFGSATGIDIDSELKLDAPAGSGSLTFGHAVSGVGDLDDDGYGDVAVGGAGGTYLYYGTPSGVVAGNVEELTAERPEGSFGYSVARGGDVDGDGYADLVVGAVDDSSANGSVHLFLGGTAGGITGTEQMIKASNGMDVDYFGWSISGGSDFDGDGYGDLVVGAPGVDDNGPNAGGVYVYSGSASGIDTDSELELLASEGESADWYGVSVSGIGDADGDGFDDLGVGAYGVAGLQGVIYLYSGSASGIRPESEEELSSSDGVEQDLFGMCLAGAGDLDGDGYHDLIVGAQNAGARPPIQNGAAYVYFGGPSGIGPSTETKLSASSVEGVDHFGGSVAGAGDVDGDGCRDLVVGSPDDDSEGDAAGAANVFYGDNSRCLRSWYRDGDGDGYGVPEDPVEACQPPSGYVESADDCDDVDAEVHPGAMEVLNDGVDQNCDGEDATTPEDGGTPDGSGDGGGAATDPGCGCSLSPARAQGGLALGLLAGLVGLRRRPRAPAPLSRVSRS